VTVHTTGRRPSATTVRVLRATAMVLTSLYGPCPHAAVAVFLGDDPAVKSLPASSASPITVHHVNSGFSQAGRVVVFRTSEMHRTIVHELVHVWKTHSLDRSEQQLFAHAKLGAPIACLLTEAFVEAVTWLVHGGFCPGGLSPAHSLRVARAYLTASDDGRTNGWAYFVGRALLVADGGARFHSAFFRTDASGALAGVRLVSADAHRALVRVMAAAYAALGGRGLPGAPAPGRHIALKLCDCTLGESFSQTRDGRARIRR